MTWVTFGSSIWGMNTTYSKSIAQAKSILGSFRALGLACGVSDTAVKKWYHNGRPPRTEYTGETRYAESIEAATNGAVSRSDLRPDLWPPDQQQVMGDSQ